MLKLNGPTKIERNNGVNEVNDNVSHVAEAASVELDVLLEWQDYLRAVYWSLFRALNMKIWLAFGPLLLLLYFYEMFQGQTRQAMVLLIPPGLLLVLIVNTYITAKRNLASQRSLSQTIHYSFSDNSIDISAPSSSSHIDWSNIYKVHETKHNFLLFIARNQMLVIPRRFFLNNEQISQFKELLRLKLPSKLKLKRTSYP
ncbi:MAG: YcxB family protein [Pyrinomonadaceae bacterium]